MDLIFVESPTLEEREYFEEKLISFNASRIEGYTYDSFIFKIFEESNALIAGVSCEVGGGWLYIAGLWVSEKYRSKRLGEKLLAASEKKAIEKDCHSSFLYTYDFQAPDFYKKYGYKVFGKLDRFYEDHAKIFMKKSLV